MQQTTKSVQLIAKDVEDLSILSSLCQDALCPVSDMAFLPEDGSFVLALNRFCWEQGAKSAPYMRIHAGLRFDQVREVAAKDLPKKSSDRMLCLLSIAYADQTVVLSFAGGSAVRLNVGALNVCLSDLGDPWPTQWRPDHAQD